MEHLRWYRTKKIEMGAPLFFSTKQKQKMSAPIVSFDGISYEITLFRPDSTGAMKEVRYVFGEHRLTVCKAHKEEWLGRTLSPQIKGDAADDGFIYYLYAQPLDVGAPAFTWLQNKEESVALQKAIEEAEENI